MIEVTIQIDFSGAAATRANVDKIIEQIETNWNRNSADGNKPFMYKGCTVAFKIEFRNPPSGRLLTEPAGFRCASQRSQKHSGQSHWLLAFCNHFPHRFRCGA